MNKIKVFACASGTGKTYLAQQHKNIIDLDEERLFYKHIIPNNLKNLSLEELKGVKKKLNPDYPTNFYNRSLPQFFHH